MSELGEIPANFEVHNWIPQLAILKQADAFITHAGMGGSQEAMAAGVPMVCVPQAADQYMNAARIQEIGAGRHVTMDQATVATLREAVLGVVNDTAVAAKLTEIQRQMVAEGGTQQAADLIEAELPA
jgi:MGT family glycosyltransferase